MNIESSAFLLLSVGELNRNKNHSIVIRAIAQMKRKDVHYCIAGTGALANELQRLADEAGIGDQVHLLGFRNDIAELLQCADVYLLPSVREGLNVSLMEAMASGLPCICSDIRGNRDLIEERKGGYRVAAEDVNGWRAAIERILDEQALFYLYGRFNREKSTRFSMYTVEKKIMNNYANIQSAILTGN